MAWFLCNVGGNGLEITVECYSGFAGLTISCTDGVSTLTKVCPSSSPYEVVFKLPNEGTWTLSTTYNGVTYTNTIEVNLTEMFYPVPNGATVTPTNDVQTWLHCANIWDKSYTTIAEVLTDGATVTALIASTNAVDYMARSTSWASSVTVDPSAMIKIGANDYCANKLLVNSTWRDAIANSAYVESVLSAKVPTMTSTTQPYGQIVYSSGVAYPLSAFDGVADSSGARHYAYIPKNQYLGYKFVNPVSVSAVRWYTNYDATTSKYNLLTGKIQYSDDGSNWVDAYSITVTPKGGLQKQLYTGYSSTKHQYWAIVPTSMQTDTNNFFFNRLQFYGRP